MTKPNIPFDMDTALQALREGKDLTGKNGVLTPLIKQLTEAAMQAELDAHLDKDEIPNRKNGSSSKTVKTVSGSFELDTPRDRANTDLTLLRDTLSADKQSQKIDINQ